MMDHINRATFETESIRDTVSTNEVIRYLINIDIVSIFKHFNNLTEFIQGSYTCIYNISIPFQKKKHIQLLYDGQILIKVRHPSVWLLLPATKITLHIVLFIHFVFKHVQHSSIHNKNLKYMYVDSNCEHFIHKYRLDYGSKSLFSKFSNILSTHIFVRSANYIETKRITNSSLISFGQ